MRLILINNLCTHYTLRSFEELAEVVDTRFLFFSDGQESFWEKANELPKPKFNHRNLPGFYLTSKIRVVPSLVTELLSSRFDIVVMALAGRFALPVTYLIARLRRKPFVLWSGLWYHPQSLFHRLSWPLTLWIYRHSDAIITYGDHVKRYLVDHGVDGEKVFPFWHCVDTEKMGRPVDAARVQSYRERWSPDGKPVILYVGRLEEVKSLDTLISAYHQLSKSRSCRLVLVGRGGQKNELKEQAANLGVDVVFEDFVPNPELPEVFAAADVFCLPSKSMPMVKEAWGLVLNEAMLQRCVPVASDAVGAAVGGLFFPEIESLVFPEQQADRLAAVLDRALTLASQPEIREKVRERSLQFSPKNQVQGLLRAIEYIENKKRNGKS